MHEVIMLYVFTRDNYHYHNMCFYLKMPKSVTESFFIGREKYKRPLEALFIRDKNARRQTQILG